MSQVESMRLDGATASIADVLADLTTRASTLGVALHPRAAQQLVLRVRVMNSNHSNLIERRITRPRDIERALTGDLDDDEGRRSFS